MYEIENDYYQNIKFNNFTLMPLSSFFSSTIGKDCHFEWCFIKYRKKQMLWRLTVEQ